MENEPGMGFWNASGVKMVPTQHITCHEESESRLSQEGIPPIRDVRNQVD